MVTLILNNEEHKLPTDLTVDQWCEIIKWDLYDEANWPRILSIATGVPAEESEGANKDALQLGIVFVGQTMVHRKETKHKNFNTLKFGEWIDLDIYIAKGLETSLKDVLKVLGSETISAQEALYVIDKYNHWRNYILRQYSLLFDNEAGHSDAVQSDVDWKKLAQSWYRIIVELADDNILHLDGVTDQPVRKAFQFLQLRKQKALEEQMKQVKLKHDVQRNRR